MKTGHHLDRLLAERIGGTDAAAAIKRACASLLAEAGISRPPIKLSILAKFLGAGVAYDNVPSVGGEEAALKIVGDNIVLWVSKEKFENSRTRSRARFSIAHEIGHLILFRMLGPEFLEHSEADDQTYHKVERLCDLAASHLLMPRDRLFEAVTAYGLTIDAVRRLAALFEVSSPALFKAIADLVPSGAMIELRKFARNSTEQLTWRVWNTYTSSETEGLSTWLPPGCTLKHIEGLTPPEALVFDAPIACSGVVLIRGKSRASRDSVIVRWPNLQSSQTDLLPSQKMIKSKLKQDTSQGRVMLLVGERNRMAFSQFGAQTP